VTFILSSYLVLLSLIKSHIIELTKKYSKVRNQLKNMKKLKNIKKFEYLININIKKFNRNSVENTQAWNLIKPKKNINNFTIIFEVTIFNVWWVQWYLFPPLTMHNQLLNLGWFSQKKLIKRIFHILVNKSSIYKKK